MFLDPEPKRHAHSQMARTPSESSMASQYHSHALRPPSKRKPLEERPHSEHNARQLGRPPSQTDKSTVRLVKKSPSPSRSPLSSSDGSSLPDRDPRFFYAYRPDTRSRASSSAEPLAGSADPSFQYTWPSSSDNNVSDLWCPTNDTNKPAFPSSYPLPPHQANTTIALKSTNSNNARRWSGSSGRQSRASTLRDTSSNGVVPDWTTMRLSQGTTLRGTPTPTELELRDQLQKDKELTRQASIPVLETLQETSPERPTPGVRSVEDSAIASSPTRNWEALDVSSRPQSAGSNFSDPRGSVSPALPLRHERRKLSEGSIPDHVAIRRQYAMPAPLRLQPSQESIAQSPLRPSSPIIVLYDSDSTYPRSQDRHLRYTPSVESIQSRLQYPTVIRPPTAHSLLPSSSLASLRQSPSEASPPPLHIPKKRVRSKPVPLARNLNSSETTRVMERAEPYLGHQFDSHLSTILSESEGTSIGNRVSHFSLGSGVLTGDDASSVPLPSQWPDRRRPSITDSLADDERSQKAPGTAQSMDEEGDMTLGLFREASAKPPPLFKAPGGMPGDKRYDGPRPPVPPIPGSRDSSENFDTVSELQAPSLKPKRSGYSLRHRSHSTPSKHSRQHSGTDSARNSTGSNIFPLWARYFYAGTVGLLSASKVSLHRDNSQNSPQKSNHQRPQSQYTEHSITSRLGDDDGEGDLESPTSSHFLPSIFRIKTRTQSNAEAVTSQIATEKRPSTSPDVSPSERPSDDKNKRRDSMEITPAPPIDSEMSGPAPNETAEDLLPSGHPRWGILKDEPDSRRPLPRSYVSQRQWDEMSFPRPMTKDRLSDFHEPHLLPSKRASQSRISLWRPPSFVESFDSLVRSRANRQILLFSLGFVCPLLWMAAAFLPVPPKPLDISELQQNVDEEKYGNVQAEMMQHEAGDAERRWREERAFLKGRWWRGLNRIMSVIGVLVLGAVIALAIIATR